MTQFLLVSLILIYMKLIYLLIIILVLGVFPQSVFAEEIKPVDIRVLTLRYYLENYDSPLAAHSQKLVQEADRYGMDWKLIPSIAAVESNFGHRIPGGKNPDYTSHNAWGWGVYGNKVMRFDNWNAGIERVTEGVNRRFINEGMTDPYKMNARYSSNPDWGWQVAYFNDELGTYAKAFEQKFGTQISSYNQKVKETQIAMKDAKKYAMPETKILVKNDRLTLNTR